MSGQTCMGIVGLGVMGQNLALNMADKGITAVTYDLWPEARTRFADSLANATGTPPSISIADTPADLVAALTPPRAILIMVKAGEPVDAVIQDLAPLLSPGDTIIDGGNSHFEDTRRRTATLNERGLHFVGLGVSGGEEGARHGPSLMAGGAPEAWDSCHAVLETIAAQFAGHPCCALLGTDGAGHFVKMVHNGIEYGIMQAIAEVFVLMRDLGGLSHAAMADVFRSWADGDLASYLIEITATILDRYDPLSDGPLVEVILDTAGQKGTGRWSSEIALELNVPTPTITDAVYARAQASRREERLVTAAALSGPKPPTGPEATGMTSEELIPALHDALLGSVIATYTQGLAVIQAGAAEYGWATDIATVAEIWRDGCVIRARLLDDIAKAYRTMDATGETRGLLLQAPAFARRLEACQPGWRRIVALAVTHGVPVPGLSSALTYLDCARSEKLWANMIQAQRDYFGAHTYERVDRPGTFHTNWIA